MASCDGVRIDFNSDFEHLMLGLHLLAEGVVNRLHAGLLIVCELEGRPARWGAGACAISKPVDNEVATASPNSVLFQFMTASLPAEFGNAPEGVLRKSLRV